LLAGIAVGGYYARKPWLLYAKQRAEHAQILRQLEQIEASEMEAVRRKLRLDSPLGKEVEAREKGWRKAGEIPLLIP
jgi:hypothetical protein